MGERNGDARAFWMKLQDNGKVDFMFEKTQEVLQSLKQKIKDGSATNRDYVQAMILINEATISNSPTKDHLPMTQTEQENKSNAFLSTSCENSFPEDCTILSPGTKAFFHVNSKAADLGEKEPPLSVSFQSHICSSACLRETPLPLKGGNPLQLPIRYHFQRRHAKTNSHSSALHVNYKTPCGRSLRNMEEVFHYLIETKCNFLFTDNFSFNTYIQLTRNYPKHNAVVSDEDISNGVESVPISFCNEIDSKKLPQFKYRKTVWPRTYYLNLSSMFSDSCDCSEGCIDIKKCACLQLTAKNAKAWPLSPDGQCTGYQYKRLQRLIPTGIYECNLSCKCNHHLCQNRVVQHGPRVRLQVFKSEKKGWGVRCLDDIDKGTFVCIYAGRLLSRATPEKTNIDENGREQQSIVKNKFSKRRKVEVACLDCETHPRSPKTEKCPQEFSSDLTEPVMKMNYRNISRIQRLSVIRSPTFKTAAFHCNEKNMLKTKKSTALEDKDGFKSAQEHLDSEARAHEDLRSNQVGYSEDRPMTESDVVDVTKREESSPEGRSKHLAPLNNETTKEVLEIPVERSQEEPAAFHSQQAFCDEELPSEKMKTPSPSLTRLSKDNAFLLDASKEGNVGRFLNHSCSPNLCVQNVFVETHDRDFPLVAFFTNRFAIVLLMRFNASGACQVTEMMEKRTCALCPKDSDCSVIYFAPSENIAAHENCLLFSSALVECENHDGPNKARNFDVKSVKKEIWRGRRLKCTLCNGGGATVGCELKFCNKNYHFVCAKKDKAVLHVKEDKGTYRLFCQQHAPELPQTSQSAESPSLQKKRGRKKRSPPSSPEQPSKMKFGRSTRNMTEHPLSHRDATVKVSFLKKCKEAGLLNELFEGILEKFDSIQGKLLNETASESDYEEIDTLLLDSGLFEDTLIKFQEVIRSKAREQEERYRQLKQQLEAVENLKQTLCSLQENEDLNHSSSSSRSSASTPKDHQFRCQGSTERQAGSEDSVTDT
ncbi:histone-lysine N-methyltransferase SETDB2 isoform X1 [Sigmodon hispidus]